MPIKNLINFKKWSLFNFSTRGRLGNNLRNIKQEPTFDTSNIKKANFFKSDTDSHSSTAYAIEYKIPSLSLLRTSINKNNYPGEIEKRNKEVKQVDKIEKENLETLLKDTKTALEFVRLANTIKSSI